MHNGFDHEDEEDDDESEESEESEDNEENSDEDDVSSDAEVFAKAGKKADRTRRLGEGEKVPQGCIVTNGELYDGRAVLMTKIDVSYGAWGLFNFYRMQIWKEKHKDLWILFTNWGRIGDPHNGQFQNTPFGSAEQAVAEFEKIFRLKSGNDWEDRVNFEEKPKRYRLVKTELLKPLTRKAALEFDLLDSPVASRLPESVQDMMEDLANVNTYIEAYKAIGADTESTPFGRIKREVVERAKKVLEDLRPYVKDEEAIEEKMGKTMDREGLQAMRFDCLEQIFKRSSGRVF